MRSPIQDENAGAATSVAPTQKHATRTATIASHNSNNALQRAKQYNASISKLGQALDQFADKKATIAQEQAYQKAYHEQGEEEGMSEYANDLKRSSFTEFIYGGQSPEYLGHLDASARNASNAMYAEEAVFVEEEGGDVTPAEYQRRLRDKVTAYNKDNFATNPDAAFAFMKNWQENSNLLSKQQAKLYQVKEQMKARQDVAEGFQLDLSKYKTLVDVDPNKAEEFGKKVFAGAYTPPGMSERAARDVRVEGAITAIEAGDFSALKLLRESPLQATLTEVEQGKLRKAIGVLDNNNKDILVGAESRLEYIIDNPASTPEEYKAALDNLKSVQAQFKARDTYSTEHFKNINGSDRNRGELSNEWTQRLEREANEAGEVIVDRVQLNASNFETELSLTPAEEKREVLSNRLDFLKLARLDPTLSQEVRLDVNKQTKEASDLLNKWSSVEDAKAKKERDALLELEAQQAEKREGISALLDGKGFIATKTAQKAEHITGALQQVIKRVVPNSDKPLMEDLAVAFSNPETIDKLVRETSPFKNYLTESKEIITASQNLAVNLSAELTEDGTFAEEQKKKTQSLVILKDKMPDVYNAAFTPEEQMEIYFLTSEMNKGSGVQETKRRLDTIKQGIPNSPLAISGKLFVEELQLTSAPDAAKDQAYALYKFYRPLGEQVARSEAQRYASSAYKQIDGVKVLYADSFEKYKGRSLQDIMGMMQKTNSSGDGKYSNDMQRVLAALTKTEKDAEGASLSKLNQVKYLKASVFNGGLLLEKDGRVQLLPRAEMERIVDDYERDNPTSRDRKQKVFLNW